MSANYEFPDTKLACLPPREKLESTDKWLDTMTLEEATYIVPAKVIEILTAERYDRKRYRNMRVLKQQRQGHWCFAVDVHPKKNINIRTLYGLVAEWPEMCCYSIFWTTMNYWQFKTGRRTFYLHQDVAEKRYGPKPGGLIVLHQGPDTDGINGHDVTLLCYGTPSDNMYGTNRNKSSNATSKYPFVAYSRTEQCWISSVSRDRKRLFHKRFKTEEEAWIYTQVFCDENKISLGPVRHTIHNDHEGLQESDLFGTDDNGTTWVLALQTGQTTPRRLKLGNTQRHPTIVPVVEGCRIYVRKHGRPLAMSERGHIKIRFNNKPEYIYRAMFRAATGKQIPQGYHIDHFDHDMYNVCPDNLGITTAKVNKTKQRGKCVFPKRKGFSGAIAAFGKQLCKTYPTRALAEAFVLEKKEAICSAIVSCAEAAALPDDADLVALVEKRASELEKQWDEWKIMYAKSVTRTKMTQ